MRVRQRERVCVREGEETKRDETENQVRGAGGKEADLQCTLIITGIDKPRSRMP